MFVVHDTATAVLFCVLTMIGWGSWANTQKLSGRRDWPFALFYWDYCLGVAVTGVLFCIALGSFGSAGQDALSNLHTAALGSATRALIAGVLFNCANVLLVAAIDAAGLAIAFPVGVGLALVIGTIVSYWQTPKGNPALLAIGVLCILGAMFVSALAHRRRAADAATGRNGVLYAVLAGALMGFFYPQLLSAMSPEFNTRPIAAGALTPYTALLLFGFGVLVSGAPLTALFLRGGGATASRYLHVSLGTHLPGILGGLIWMIALTLNIIASAIAGPAVSYALGQGATLVAALWGIFVWHEFRGARRGTGALLALMLGGYCLGLILIGLATP